MDTFDEGVDPATQAPVLRKLHGNLKQRRMSVKVRCGGEEGRDGEREGGTEGEKGGGGGGRDREEVGREGEGGS